MKYNMVLCYNLVHNTIAFMKNTVILKLTCLRLKRILLLLSSILFNMLLGLSDCGRTYLI